MANPPPVVEWGVEAAPVDPNAHPVPPTPDASPWTWEALVRALLVHARHLGAPPEDAEDLVQDAIARTVADEDWYDPDRGSLLALLKTVVQRRWIDRRRGLQVHDRARPALELVPQPAPDPESETWRTRAATRRQVLLAHLTPAEREVFRVWLRQRRREVDGRQAAELLDLSPAAWEAAKKRLRRRVHALLDALELEPSDLFDGGGP